MGKSLKGLQGSIVALVTPFAEDGSVDFDALARLIDFHLESGTDAILVLGTTGESSTMSHEEDDAVCEFTVKRVAGRVPVIAGSGSNTTQTMLEKSLSYQNLGVDGLLLITPYYNKTSQRGLVAHYTYGRLAKHPNAFGIKEASGSISYATKIARFLSDDFVMFSGNDDIVVPLMSLGAKGVISVWANVMPREVHEMTWNYLEGRHDEALAEQLRCLDLIDALFCEVNPIPVKGALEMMGMGKAVYRLPLCELSEAGKVRVAEALKGVGLVD